LNIGWTLFQIFDGFRALGPPQDLSITSLNLREEALVNIQWEIVIDYFGKIRGRLLIVKSSIMVIIVLVEHDHGPSAKEQANDLPF
jgi:hypothetical protein